MKKNGFQTVDNPCGRTELHEACFRGDIGKAKNILSTNPQEIINCCCLGIG